VFPRNTLLVVFFVLAAWRLWRLWRLPEAIDGRETTANGTMRNGGME
jgi:hypothetical protein